MLVVAKWIPGGAILMALFAQAAIGQNSYVTVGLAISCLTGVWYVADMRQKIVGRLDNHEKWESEVAKKLDSMVTHDALQLKLYEERELNDKRYMKSDSCDDQHKTLNQILDKVYHQQQVRAAKAGE